MTTITTVAALPLCADPARDAAIRSLVDRSVELVVDGVGPSQLEGVVLTGSLSRSEGSVILGGAAPRLLGDIEFLTIVRESRSWAAVRRRMVELGELATRQLGRNGDITTIEYTPASVRYLTRTIRPSIFAYDLRCHGRVMWGRPDLLGLIAPFGVDAIPRPDAMELVMNRLIELLALESDIDRAPVDPWVCGYQMVKTILDLAGSALAFTGRHTAKYAERPAAFGLLLVTRPDLTAALPDAVAFEKELSLAARTKLVPTDAALRALGTRDRLSAVIRWASAFWLWEARQLLRRPGAAVDELVNGYLRDEPLAERLRGWLKFYAHPLRPEHARRVPSLRSGWLPPSPRRRVYAAAMTASVGRATSTGDWAAQAARFLPVADRTTDRVPERIVDCWRWLVRNN